MTTPLAIFTYNRPQHIRKLFDSLLQCPRLKECDVYIFCDGVNTPDDRAGAQASREVVHEYARLLENAHVIERDRNFGLARSIVNGVTEVCARYGRVIALEDDFILHPSFLAYMLQSLDQFADDERIAQVAGFTFPINKSPTPDAFFMPITSPWGWATWQRAWELFSWDTQSALAVLDADPGLRARFDLDGSCPFADVLIQIHNGKLDTWDVQWYWRTFSANKLTIYPRQSLVWQNGFDKSATHTKSAWPGIQPPLEAFLQNRWDQSISFPNSVQVDKIAYENLKTYFRHHRSITRLSRIKRILKPVLARLIR
jgi:Glycosyl transferase family 2